MAYLRPIPRVRIVSDGRRDTRIYDADGREILAGCVRSIAWEKTGPGMASVFIRLTGAQVDLEGEVEELAT